MASSESLSDTEQQVTPACVQWRPYGAVRHTYGITSPPETHTWPQSSMEKNGQYSTSQKLNQHFTNTIIPQVRFTPEDISPCLVQDDEDMSILMHSFDTYMIRLVVRWRSNTMLIYLHSTAHTFAIGLTALMVQHRDYVPIPPAYGGLKPRSQTMGLSSSFSGF